MLIVYSFIWIRFLLFPTRCGPSLVFYPLIKNNWGAAVIERSRHVTKWNESCHFCAHTGWIGPGEPPEDDEMTLPSRHRIRNSNPGGLRPSTLPLGPSCDRLRLSTIVRRVEYYTWTDEPLIYYIFLNVIVISKFSSSYLFFDIICSAKVPILLLCMHNSVWHVFIVQNLVVLSRSKKECVSFLKTNIFHLILCSNRCCLLKRL